MAMRMLLAALLIGLTSAHYAGTVHNLFTSVKRDIPPQSARVNGTMPRWLDVERYGNGFGKFEGGEGRNHWKWNFLFDVTAYTFKWTVKGDQVTFVTKVTNSSYHSQGLEHMPYARTFYGTKPDMNAWQKMRALTGFAAEDNFNVNIVQMGGHVLAISDMAGAMEVHPDTLETLGPFKFHDDLWTETKRITCAHPSQLPNDKYLYNYLVNMVPQNLTHMYTTQFWRLDTTKLPLSREVVYEEYSSQPPPYMHQFANTANYLILFEYPLFWHEMGIIMGTNVLPNMKWDPKMTNGTKVKVLDKRSWKVVRTFTTEAFFAYHHLNAYEDPVSGHAIVEIMTVPCEGAEKDPSLVASCLHMNAFNLETLPTAGWDIPRGSLRRFTVPLHGSDDISFEDLNHFGMDLYAIHPALKGRKHRYVWSMGNHGDESHEGVWWNSIIKIDQKTNKTLEWWKEDHYPSEVSFIPRPGAFAEDDGVLISTVMGVPEQRSYLLVLDARTLKQIATADAPEFLPFPSHGHSCAPVHGKRICFWG